MTNLNTEKATNDAIIQRSTSHNGSECDTVEAVVETDGENSSNSTG